jgi:Mrp family chromosome partitioning ATPase
MLLGPATEMLLRIARETFDTVIIDSSPVLAADDTCSLAPKVDGVLFLLRRGFTRTKVAAKALESLRQRHATVLGLVFNRASLHSHDGYYYRYKGYYGRGGGDQRGRHGGRNGNSKSKGRQRGARQHARRSDRERQTATVPVVGLKPLKE